jgi:hypothetical protein
MHSSSAGDHFSLETKVAALTDDLSNKNEVIKIMMDRFRALQQGLTLLCDE